MVVHCTLLFYTDFVLISGSCTDGTLRLMEGGSEYEGRLEVCFSDRWGTFGSDGWTQINTQVVCNDLGYDLSGN